MAKISPRIFHSKSGREFTVRTCQVQDAAALLKFAKGILSESLYSLLSPEELAFTEEQEAHWIHEQVESPDNLLIVAELDGQLVGDLNFSANLPRRIAHTGDFGMAVGKEFREQGIGGALLTVLLDWAYSNAAIEKINLKVHVTNERAIGLYRKFGFVQEGRLARDLKYGENQYVDTLLMGKWL